MRPGLARFSGLEALWHSRQARMRWDGLKWWHTAQPPANSVICACSLWAKITGTYCADSWSIRTTSGPLFVCARGQGARQGSSCVGFGHVWQSIQFGFGLPTRSPRAAGACLALSADRRAAKVTDKAASKRISARFIQKWSRLFGFVEKLPKGWKKHQEEYGDQVLDSFGEINKLLKRVRSVHGL